RRPASADKALSCWRTEARCCALDFDLARPGKRIPTTATSTTQRPPASAKRGQNIFDQPPGSAAGFSDFFGRFRATSAWSILRVAECNSNGAPASSRRLRAQAESCSPTFLFGSSGMSFKPLDGIRRRFLPRKDRPRNVFEPVQAFAQARADGLHVQQQHVADFLVAQVAEVTQFNNFAARLAELVE